MWHGSSPGYFEEGSHWVEFREGRVSISQLYGSDAEWPHITASIVGWVQLLLTRYYLQQTKDKVKKKTQKYKDKILKQK